MIEQESSIIDKNKIKNHVSSGGFIFYKDKESDEIFTLLVKNKKGEYWIPKGHLEEGENQVETAFREIVEETNMKKSQLRYVGFCSLIKYLFTEDKSENCKEVYINVFEALEKEELTHKQGELEIFDIRWFKYINALDAIAYNTEELAYSKEMFEKYLSNN